MKGGTGIGNPCSVHVDIHTVQMGKVSQTFQLFGCINRSEFGALGDVKRTGLRMMLVAEAVSQLPDRCREVFRKSREEGLSNAAIADQMQISVKTVEAQITKALRRIRETLLRT